MKTRLIILLALFTGIYTGFAQNVGIGVPNPVEKLDVAGAIKTTGSIYCGTDFEIAAGGGIGSVILNDKAIRMRSGADLTHYIEYHGTAGFNGIKIAGHNTISLQTAGNSFEVMLRNGRLGVGTNNPTNGKVHINGEHNGYSSGDFHFYQKGSSGCGGGPGPGYEWKLYFCGSSNWNTSLYATDWVVGQGFISFSDERIKNIIGVSDASEDLDKLLKIKITDYTFKDQLSKGTGIQKKVVAQQIESIFPQAVSYNTEVVPDIYTMSLMENGFVSLKNEDIKVGDRVRLMFVDEKVMANVISVNDHGFAVDINKSGEVFVYGREVDDYRMVDYEALAMLNISATQEQQRLIEALLAEVTNLKKENAELKSFFESRLESLENKLGTSFVANTGK